MSKRAEQMAQKAYPKEDGKVWHSAFGTFEFDKNAAARKAYQEGYEQAEKDLALTWEDMKQIHHIAEHLKEYLDADIIVPFGANQEAFYTEVLRRFNEMKGVKIE